MADWYGSARTNYFRVKDESKFRKWAESIGDLEVVKDKEGRVALLSILEFGQPRVRSCETTGVEDVIDFIDLAEEMAEHLQDGSVAVFIEVGAEKLNYLVGYAVAVNAKGKTVAISLGQIYDLAETLGSEVTTAEW